ncbi:MAG: hypothetical protein M1813_002173 [Trichoglossum hirsutum]|nr:MAG: hypothetical protein M1813_002173 [Trichoglossum hirsutum]
MKSANSLGALATPIESTDPLYKGCVDSGNTVDECHLGVSIAKRDGNDVDYDPFHDCLNSGKTFEACRLAVPITKRDGNDVDYTPFHDCLNSGKSFDQCRVVQGLKARSDVTLVERGWDGVINELSRAWGGQSKCYSENRGHWLTNTAVRKIAKEACTEALKQVGQTGIGLFTKKLTGFYDGLLGPVVKPNVKFLLSTYVQKKVGIDFNLDTIGEELCEKGVNHLADDGDCNTAKKVGVIVSHRAVRGGIFDWTIDGSAPVYGNDGACSNCILSIVIES